ncbi:hypothetical protein psyc5s11_34030 [Clostridium gelidum]|uniref:Uncharacterized protein n=1 Tax=Clostridium gelidum TaxID=704125 RepID=A0ABN6J087_9CLOT|nr:hypothetical protein [Clostridium gelidum]BCZ47336.1 hypothetical protein psyc5s11_34030 [Clostridium gelidum]
MPVVLVFMGVAALVTGISALVVHNSISKSTSSSNILSEIGEAKENLDKEIKTKLFLGTVTIIAYIAEREQMKKKQQEEMLQSIGGGVAASTELSTAATIKVAQDTIAELQTEQGQGIGSTTSQTTEVSGSVAITNDGSIIPPLIPPAIDDGPITPPLNPPAIPDAGQITPPLIPPVIDAGQITKPLIPPPDDGPIIPPLIPPALKELEDYILWATYNDLPNDGVWPKWNEGTDTVGEFKNELDKLFGQEGHFKKDGPNSKGRKRYEWVLPDGTIVWWERHPYDRKNGAPTSHTEPHYHVNTSSNPHGTGFEGTD